MKKLILLTLVLPIALVSCSAKHTSFEDFKEKVQQVEDTIEYPYYKVIGSLDFNNEITHVDATFDQTPKANEFVPYARYNEGFFNEIADMKTEDTDIVIYGMASRSYWLRAPLRINKDNFFVKQQVGEAEIVNKSCASYIIQHLITSYLGETGSTNPSKNQCYYELLPDGGFVIGGEKVHTKVTIDNYPIYPDKNFFRPVEEGGYGDWDEADPLPCYKNIVNAKVDIRFEYNAKGWLVKESMTSVGYDYNQPTASQVSLEAVYSYKGLLS